MPRRQPRPGAVQSAHGFVQVFIESCSSDDHILPKNGEFRSLASLARAR